jgi:hypothetical protein
MINRPVDDVVHQLRVERQLRNAAELTANDLRRDNARLAAMSQRRTHYILMIPKPRWGVWREQITRWAAQLKAGLVSFVQAAQETAWPKNED